MAEVTLKTPLSESTIRSLKVGDKIYLSGSIFTARDRIHKYLFDHRPSRDDIPFDIVNGVLYHCGPIVRKHEGEYRFISGAPTTSIRLELYEDTIIKEYGIRAIIGKGGMGERTLSALRQFGCIYLHTISGAAVYLADRVVKVEDVWKLDEFGEPEAMWLLEVEDFPAIVTMDSNGKSLHEEIRKRSFQKAEKLLKSPVL